MPQLLTWASALIKGTEFQGSPEGPMSVKTGPSVSSFFLKLLRGKTFTRQHIQVLCVEIRIIHSLQTGLLRSPNLKTGMRM